MVAGMFTSLSFSSSAVLKKAKKVSLKKSSATLKISKKNGKNVYGKTTVKVKKTKGVKVKKITYKSSAAKIAKVSKKGKVTAKSEGKAKIKVKVKYKYKKKSYKKTLTFKVTVKDLRKNNNPKTPTPVETEPETSADVVATTTPAQTAETTEPPFVTAPIQTETAAETATEAVESGETQPQTELETEEGETNETAPSTESVESGETQPQTASETEAGEINDTTPSTEAQTTEQTETVETTSPAPTEKDNVETDFNDLEEVTEPVTEEEISGTDFKTKLSAFSNKLYKICAENENDNYAMSPLSVYMTLSMLYSIGDENVKSDVAGFVGMTKEEFAETGELFKSLIEQKTDYFSDDIVTQLSLTNSIWLDNNVEANADELKKLAEELYCEAYHTSFKEDNAAANKAVQDFVKEKTNGLIDQNFNISEETLAALINTLYFKDVWSREDELFSKEDFFQTPDEKKKCEFLISDFLCGRIMETATSSYFYTTTSAGYKIKFILPKEGVTLKQAMNAADLYKINGTTDFQFQDPDGTEHYTRCIFPTFKISSETPLKKIFEDNEVLNKAFGEFYSPLVDGELFVTDVKQKTVLDVNKKGIEGAAVTLLSMSGSAMPENPQVFHDFELNRSFGYIITSPDDVVLFEGQVTNPGSDN
jgi:serine protease inhibitor